MKNFKTPDEALVYIADCTLATIETMASKKSKSKYEFQRQIDIAQTAVDALKQFNTEIKESNRVYDVLRLPDQKVETWSKKYLP